MPTDAKISSAWRWVTNALGLSSGLFFSGIIFGWAPLELILLREGQYSELCSEEEGSFCAARMSKLNLIFTLAQFFLSFASLPVGFFLDHAPKTMHFAIAAFCEITGLILFGISDSATNDWFPFAYSLMAVGGCMTYLGSFPASFLLPQYQAGLLAAGSCLFDASSVIFFVFHRLDLTGIPAFRRADLFTYMACLAAVVYAGLIVCWSDLEKKDWKGVVEAELAAEAGVDESMESHTSLQSSDPHRRRIHQMKMHHRTVAKQLGTFDFVLVLVFAAIHMLRCNFFIMTVDSQLFSIGDDNSKYANIFSLVLPAGVVMVPFIEATVSRLGILNTLHLTNGLGILFGALLLVPSLPIQGFNFFLLACFRAFLYASLNTFIAITFGVHTMGRIFGFVFTNAAILSLIQYPASILAESYFGGDYLVMNAVFLGMGVLPVILALVYTKATLTPTAKLSKGGTSVDYGTIMDDWSDDEEDDVSVGHGAPLLLTAPGSELTRSLRMSMRASHRKSDIGDFRLDLIQVDRVENDV